MRSKWFNLKQEAISLRKIGNSIRDVEISLGIPRSTLSGWFKSVELTHRQKINLKNRHKENLIKAREKAIIWHNNQKINRIMDAERKADTLLLNIKSNKNIIELGLAMLYLGEGAKKSPTTSIGNSDPLILKFFLKILTNIYEIKINKIAFYLHLRSDQNPRYMKKYWSGELNVPIERFGKVSIDKRTLKTKTYSHYKGVCVINCGNVAIQRKLVYIGRKFCKKTIEDLGD